MTKERLEEIKDSIELQMQVQQSLGYRSSYDDLLTEEIDLYNEVIELQQRLDKAIEFLDKVRKENGNEIGQVNYEMLVEILKGESNNECN